MEIINTKEEWDDILNKKFSEFDDIYYRYDYFNLFSKNYNAQPECVFWEDENINIFWTHLVRKIILENTEKDPFFDLTTPYGYGGPLIIIKNPDNEEIEKSLNFFFKEYERSSIEKNYVCEFIRFHPCFQNWKFFNKYLILHHLNDIVIVDLVKEIDSLWKEIQKDYRYNINKSIREGCLVEIIDKPSDEDINNFINLYYTTMQRNNASKKYFFPVNFIKDHFNQINSTILINIVYNNEIVSSSIFLLGKTIVHHHLNGNSQKYKQIFPSRLIVWEGIKWAKNHHYQSLQLGGGRGINDLLYNFKKGFSSTSVPFYTGKIIFNQKKYEDYVHMNKHYKPDENFFPGYRQGFNDTII